MKTDEIMLKVENVSKVYKLGEIGGTTLRDELQRLKAKILKKEDPTKKIGAKNYNKGEKFKALDNISFEVKKGERIGIIGHNGAGKSTLLKLISRVTGPTEGKIYLNGRVASMLEVGTGFHPELTGRENIYMNGAILGMTKKEIDAKMEDIIEFSEVRQFIDTPVKRYSSGMYVKLAFSVAAHLNSEIMIMDEVLAVGDMAFQNKCLSKMKHVSEQDDRTILYVSHNMNTIKQLCDRVIVLKSGHVVFDGDVSDGIKCYLGVKDSCSETFFDVNDIPRPSSFHGSILRISSLEFLKKNEAYFVDGEPISFKLKILSSRDFIDSSLLLTIFSDQNFPVGTAQTKVEDLTIKKGENTVCLSLNIGGLVSGSYSFAIDIFSVDEYGNHISYDQPVCKFYFKIQNYKTKGIKWNSMYFGNIEFSNISILKEK
ncbi:MAG: ATP-binding cassette domain-containing protein [Clostridia bacterium]|nr:ATP-binding cassette domain-containing protein [Clostridia bacterium]